MENFLDVFYNYKERQFSTNGEGGVRDGWDGYYRCKV